MMRALTGAAALLLVVVVSAHARGLSIRQLIAECSIDARRNPILLACPAGCVVEIHNGATVAQPPRIVIAPACQRLR